MARAATLGFLALLVTQCVADKDALLSSLSSPDTEEAQCLALVQGASKLKGKHLRETMKRGWWDCSLKVVELGTAQGVHDLESEYNLASRTLKKQLGSLKTAIEGAKSTQVVNPAFEWAQSPNEVFLNIKFAHKLDAPATLDVKVQNVTITEERVYLYAEKGSKHFELDLDLMYNIVPDTSSWQLGSVGRCSFTLIKKDRRKWDRLLSSVKRPQNMHLWWNMQDQYDDALEALVEEEEKAWQESQARSKAHFQELQDRKDGKTPPKTAKKEDEKKDADKEEAKKGSDEPVDELDLEEQKIRKKHEKELKKKLKEINSRRKKLNKDFDNELEAKKKEIDEEMQKKKDEAEEEVKKKRGFVEDELAKEKAAAKEASTKATEDAVKELREPPKKKGFSLFGKEL